MGICPNCGSNKAAPNRVRCEECLIKNAENNRKSRERKSDEEKKEILIKNAIRQKNRTEQRKSAGICIICGKRPICRSSTVFCTECRIKNQRNNERRKTGIERSERPLYGLCYRCGEKLDRAGKLCTKCAKTSIDNLKNADLTERKKYIRSQNKIIFLSKSSMAQK